MKKKKKKQKLQGIILKKKKKKTNKKTRKNNKIQKKETQLLKLPILKRATTWIFKSSIKIPMSGFPFFNPLRIP